MISLLLFRQPTDVYHQTGSICVDVSLCLQPSTDCGLGIDNPHGIPLLRSAEVRSAALMCIEAFCNVLLQHDAHLTKQSEAAGAAPAAAPAASSSGVMGWAMSGLSASAGMLVGGAPAAPQAAAPAASAAASRPLSGSGLGEANGATVGGRGAGARVAAAVATAGARHSGSGGGGGVGAGLSSSGTGGAAADGWDDDDDEFMDMEDEDEKQVRRGKGRWDACCGALAAWDRTTHLPFPRWEDHMRSCQEAGRWGIALFWKEWCFLNLSRRLL